jgi:hypothetical protein
MSPRTRAILRVAVLLAVVGLLMLLFPRAYAFAEMAARELRYFWWLILLVGVWLLYVLYPTPGIDLATGADLKPQASGYFVDMIAGNGTRVLRYGAVRATDANGTRLNATITVLPEGEDVGIRYYGLPWGYELGSLLGAVLEAGKRESSLAPESLERLTALDKDLAIDVFVTPT